MFIFNVLYILMGYFFFYFIGIYKFRFKIMVFIKIVFYKYVDIWKNLFFFLVLVVILNL